VERDKPKKSESLDKLCRSYHGNKKGGAMIIFVFFIFLAFWPFPWQRQPFWKNQPLKAQLHMPYDIPTGFHKV
jgi:hypothetical protein